MIFCEIIDCVSYVAIDECRVSKISDHPGWFNVCDNLDSHAPLLFMIVM